MTQYKPGYLVYLFHPRHLNLKPKCIKLQVHLSFWLILWLIIQAPLHF